MSFYELTFIIPARVKEPQEIKAAVLSIIKEKGGEIGSELDFGKRRLAYAINHARNGEYAGIEFKIEKSDIKKINDSLNVMDDIARFQISQIERLSDKSETKTSLLRAETIEKRPEFRIKEEAPKEKIDITLTTEKSAASEIAPPVLPETITPKEIPETTSPAPKKEKDEKVSLEDLDKKLEEILDEEVK